MPWMLGRLVEQEVKRVCHDDECLEGINSVRSCAKERYSEGWEMDEAVSAECTEPVLAKCLTSLGV